MFPDDTGKTSLGRVFGAEVRPIGVGLAGLKELGKIGEIALVVFKLLGSGFGTFMVVACDT